MPQDSNKLACAAIAGLAIIILLAYTVNQTTGNDSTGVPAVEGEGQVMGLGVAAGLNLPPAGNPLDMDPAIHFWSPGVNPRDKDSPQPTVQSRHRYPIIPGGNMSTVMHKGWSAMTECAPADNDWRTNPPEAAIL